MSKATELFKRIHAISASGLASNEPKSIYCKPMWVNPQSLDVIIDLASEGRRLPEAPFTPAQQHADEMLGLLHDFRKSGGIGINASQRVAALLDKIDPPKPVTLDEAINALHDMADHLQPRPGALDAARALLRRSNEGVKYKVFATAKGENIQLPTPSDYAPGCIDAKSFKKYKDFIAAGWTDLLLIEHGYIK